MSSLLAMAEAVGGVGGLAGKRIKAAKYSNATAPNSVKKRKEIHQIKTYNLYISKLLKQKHTFWFLPKFTIICEWIFFRELP